MLDFNQGVLRLQRQGRQLACIPAFAESQKGLGNYVGVQKRSSFLKCSLGKWHEIVRR